MKLWFRYGLHTFLWSLGVALLYLVIATFSSAFSADISDILIAFPYYVLLGCAMFAVMMTNSIYILQLPVSLSMGRTRRETLLGIHVMTLTPVCGVILFCLLFCLIVRNDMTRDMLLLLPAAAAALVTTTCVGHCMGCASIRFPKFGKVISFIAIMIVCGGAGGVMGWIGASGIFPSFEHISFSCIVTVIVFGVMLIMLAVTLPFQRSVLRRYEVKL